MVDIEAAARRAYEVSDYPDIGWDFLMEHVRAYWRRIARAVMTDPLKDEGDDV